MAERTLVTSSVSLAAKILRAGMAVAFPTETVYGLGASAYDARAVKKIFIAKGRPHDNPLIVHVHSVAQIRRVARTLPPSAKKLIRAFFPGPLSIVLPKSPRIPSAVTAGLSTVCVRMPSSALARRFIKACGVPIAAPSANLSGRPSPTTYAHVLHDLNGRVPCILKGPPSKHGLESTVIDCTGSVPVLLRAGSLPIEKIVKVVGAIALPRGKSAPRSPGMKYRHYAPEAKLFIVKDASAIPSYGAKGNFAFIGAKECKRARLSVVAANTQAYAKKLFSFLRQCDALGVGEIYAQTVSEKGMGRAVMERLRKAASKR